MPTTYIVEEATKAEQWSGDRGTFQAWNIKLVDGSGEYEATTNTKPEKDFPEPGQKVEGDLIPGPKGLRFKRFYGGARGNSGGKQGEPYRKHPAEVAGARRAHAQEVAVYYAAILQKAHPEMKPNYEWLEGVIQFFDDDARKAAEAAE